MTKDEADDIKRHFDVVAENLDSKIQAVAEGVAVNGEKIDRLGGQVDRVEGRLEGVEVRLDRVESRLETGEVRTDLLEGTMRAGFRSLEGETRRGFSELGKRVERLESKPAL